MQLPAVIISFTVQDQLYFEMDKKLTDRRTNAVGGLLSLYADDYVLCNSKAKEAKSGTILPTTALTGEPEKRSESCLLWLATIIDNIIVPGTKSELKLLKKPQAANRLL